MVGHLILYSLVEFRNKGGIAVVCYLHIHVIHLNRTERKTVCRTALPRVFIVYGGYFTIIICASLCIIGEFYGSMRTKSHGIKTCRKRSKETRQFYSHIKAQLESIEPIPKVFSLARREYIAANLCRRLDIGGQNLRSFKQVAMGKSYVYFRTETRALLQVYTVVRGREIHFKGSCQLDRLRH